MYQAVPSSILALPAAHQNVSDALPAPSGSFPDSSQLTPGSYSHYPAHGQGYTPAGQSNQNPVLPPFSNLQTMGLPFLQQANVLSIRFDNGHSQPTPRQRSQPGSSGKKRAPGSTDVTSADSFDIEEDTGQLPDSVLVAPLEVLRDLVDVASERTAKVPLYWLFTWSGHQRHDRKMGTAADLKIGAKRHLQAEQISEERFRTREHRV